MFSYLLRWNGNLSVEVQTVIKLKLIIFLFIFTQRLEVHSVCLLAINVAGN